MKKKPNGFVSVLLALCLLLAPMTVFAESNAQLNYVTDDAGILTDSQWEDLELSLIHIYKVILVL